jgi:hypothetical protein
VFLARLIGIYCVVVAAAMLARRNETIAAVDAMAKDPGATMLAGVIALLGGVAIILGHNVWNGGGLSVVITLVGWTAAIKGAWLLATPSELLRKIYGALNYQRWFGVYMGLTLALGAYLIWASL